MKTDLNDAPTKKSQTSDWLVAICALLLIGALVVLLIWITKMFIAGYNWWVAMAHAHATDTFSFWLSFFWPVIIIGPMIIWLNNHEELIPAVGLSCCWVVLLVAIFACIPVIFTSYAQSYWCASASALLASEPIVSQFGTVINPFYLLIGVLFFATILHLPHALASRQTIRVDKA